MKKPKDSVDAYMARLDHPLKAEVEAIRAIILGVNPTIIEQVKWNAPSFRQKDYIATFNLRATHHVHLIFHNPAIARIESPILSGDYADRRMAYFTDMNDVTANTAELQRVVGELIRLMDA